MPPPAISPRLLEALHVTEVRTLEGFEALAMDNGNIRYRPRATSRTELPRRPLAVFGDTRLGGPGFVAASQALDTEISCRDGHAFGLYIVCVLGGRVRYRYPGSDAHHVGSAGEALLAQIDPRTDPDVRVTTSDGSARANLVVDPRRLQRRLEALLERPLEAPPRFAPRQAWPEGVVRSLQRLVWHVAGELEDPYSLLAGGVGLAEFEEVVFRLLLEGVPHDHLAPLGRATAAPAAEAAYRRAVAFMRAHLTEPLTVERIAAQAGCPARSPAATFRAHGGRTVTAALRDLRLDAARAALAGGGAARGVAEVAALYGFSNPGRFSRQYRERFGEQPSRARDRGTAGAEPPGGRGGRDWTGFAGSGQNPRPAAPGSLRLSTGADKVRRQPFRGGRDAGATRRPAAAAPRDGTARGSVMPASPPPADGRIGRIVTSRVPQTGAMRHGTGQDTRAEAIAAPTGRARPRWPVRRRGLAVGALLLALGAAAGPPPAAWAQAAAEDGIPLAARLQRIADAYVAGRAGPEHLTGVAFQVSLGRRGPGVFVSSGTDGRDSHPRPMERDTLFPIGSSTKAFTAALALLIEAQGRLGIDQTVGDRLPQYPAWKPGCPRYQTSPCPPSALAPLLGPEPDGAVWSYVGETFSTRVLIADWPRHDPIVTTAANSAPADEEDFLVRSVLIPPYAALKDAGLVPGAGATAARGAAAGIAAAGTDGASAR